jgi:hypothetical protein
VLTHLVRALLGFDHLRDGFVRAVQARMKERAKKGEMTDDEAQVSYLILYLPVCSGSAESIPS